MGKKGGMGAMLFALLALAAIAPIHAHKPVTSKYTFAEDVYPIFNANCGGCHVTGGIAPMSLLTYEDARPWAESIRVELTSGHMPPWYGDPGVAPLRDVHRLSPRDLDVVLTWVSGGTPPGAPSNVGHTDAKAASAVRRGASRGRPDIVIPIAAAVTLPADKSEDTREFVLRAGNDRDRLIAFADLIPTNPSIVHDATVFTRRPDSTTPSTVVALWLPGGMSSAPAAGLGFPWRAGEALVARIHYKKNWKLENKAATDRSAVDVYLVKSASPREIRAIAVGSNGAQPIGDHLQGLAVRTDNASSDAQIKIDALRPDGSRVAVAGFATRAGWDQRYWLARPIDLPKGTRLQIDARRQPVPNLHVWLEAAVVAF